MFLSLDTQCCVSFVNGTLDSKNTCTFMLFEVSFLILNVKLLIFT